MSGMEFNGMIVTGLNIIIIALFHNFFSIKNINNINEFLSNIIWL